MDQEMVSIITPCYNGEKYISETIRSVMAQTYQNWEMLIIDDGSVDHSTELVRKYADQDGRIQLYRQKNSGSAAARNNGIRRARGRYIVLLDADDLWLPDFLEKQIAFMQKNNAVCVFCSYGRINDKSEEILKPVKAKAVVSVADMMVMNRIGCLSGLYDSKKYGKVYLHEELKSIRDDYAYWLDIVKLEGKAYGNPEVLAKYRVLSGSTTGKKMKLVKKQYQFYREYLQLNALRSAVNVVRWGVAGVGKFYL